MIRITISLFLALSALVSASAQTVVNVDVKNVIARIPHLIYGAGAEDVNHEIYGGLYDQRIFGESFEEPAPVNIDGFGSYDEPAQVEKGMLRWRTERHGKIVYEGKKPVENNGSAEVDVLLSGKRSISGLIIRVSDAGNGADNFRGYEFALNTSGRLVVGKHVHNWQPIASVPTEIDVKAWNNLRVDFHENKFTVFINGKQVYDFQDNDKPLMEGTVGLRTFGGSADFCNLRVGKQKIALRAESFGVSGMWMPVGKGKFAIDGKDAFHGSYSQKIVGRKGAGVANKSLNKWGIGIEQGKQMTGYVFLKGTAKKAVVALQNEDGTIEYCRQQIDGITDEWQKFDFMLTPDASDNNSRFVIALDEKGTIWADMAMLHTDSYPYRQDLTRAFEAEGLTFLRYGGTMINAPEYKTRNMTGEAWERPPYTGHWYRYSTNGFGIKEFVEFARKINTEPTFSVNIEDNPQDVLRLLDEMRHLNIAYIEIGNEEILGDKPRSAYEHYVERFLAFYDAIHPVYPDLKFINAAWWRSDKPELMEYVFRQLDGKSALWDYHPWTDEIAQAREVEKELNLMRRMFLSWNPNTDMRCAILEENGNTHSLHRALSHAVVLNIVRRQNGFVELDSPANALQPYKQNDNGWNQGQIFFNSSEVWCQPPYYAQQMASAHHQPLLVASECADKGLDITATRNEAADKVVVHIVNTRSEKQNVEINVGGVSGAGSVKVVSLSGNLADCNTPDNPKRVVPKEFSCSEPNITLEGNSYTVVEIVCK